MSITTSALTRAAAAALAVAGLIFILIQPLHPAEDAASLTTDTWVIVHGASTIMAILGLAGITGIYLRGVGRFAVLGLIAYSLFSLYFILQAAYTFVEAFIVPLVAVDSPRLAEDLASLFAAGHVPHTDLGILAVFGPIGAVLYLIGGALFGIAIIRTGVLPRWAGILLVLGAAASLAAAVLPHDLARYAAIPMGAALIALGYSLWSEHRTTGARSDGPRAERIRA